MYTITDELAKISEKYKLKYFQEILGISYTYTGGIINRKQSCSELIAKAIISICFGIPINDEQVPELLEKYFIQTKE